MRIAPHRHAREAKRELRRQFPENLVGARAAGAAIGDQADAVAARGLFAGQIDHMAEQAADRRAKDVQDVQWRHRLKPPLKQRIRAGCEEREAD